MGEGDFDLRNQHPEKSWIDAVDSTARLYRILDGKAIIELWSHQSENIIKGYNLHYFNREK